jgi:hypothetical protein
MDVKCDRDSDPSAYDVLVKLCEVSRDYFHRDATLHMTLAIDVAQRCALGTSDCGEYEACLARRGDHD